MKSGAEIAMKYFGGARTGAEFLAALGRPESKGGNFPFQLRFGAGSKRGFVPVEVPMTSCAAKLSGCSCNDCPSLCIEHSDGMTL